MDKEILVEKIANSVGMKNDREIGQTKNVALKVWFDVTLVNM